eukprot:NODE_384_length_8342_cov_0.411379.p5 type:complete len:128 gc:universal NODE_384_length_8342_cov_0.411379:5254-5637(+)
MHSKSRTEVKFTCSLIEDKLTIFKYFGEPSENYIEFKKQLESIASKCKWTKEQSLVQLERTLGSTALQSFLDTLTPRQTFKQMLDLLQSRFLGADAERRFKKEFRQMKQKPNSGQISALFHESSAYL